MKIAVTSQNRTQITEHAGHCQHFWIYQVVNQSITQKTLVDVASGQTFHKFAGKIPDHCRQERRIIHHPGHGGTQSVRSGGNERGGF
jgi:predicted Fe-Mo cluster-binding NifX family protein